jgi:hypothetical protein
MKKKILIGLAIAAVLGLAVVTATSLAAGPQDGTPGTLQQMWSACQSGNWQGMIDAMKGAQASGATVCPGATSGVGGCGGGNIGTGARLY